MRGSTVFSEIDFNKAFHQIELADEQSKVLTTVETPRGIFRHKVLIMGLKGAIKELQLAVRHVITRGLKGVKGIHDNLLVHGVNREEHDENLVALCKRLLE